MIPASGLDTVYGIFMAVHLVGSLAFGFLSLSTKDDPAKRRLAMFSGFSHFPFFVGYLWLLLDAGLVVQPTSSALFPQPFWIASILWTVATAVAVGLVERLSKVHGTALILFATASTYMFWLSGREDIHKPRDALYSLAWVSLGGIAINTIVASRLRRNVWADYDGRTFQGLPFTMFERLLQHLSSGLFLAMLTLNGLMLGLSPAIGHRIPYSDQFIGYIIFSILSVALSVLQYASHREIGTPGKAQ